MLWPVGRTTPRPPIWKRNRRRITKCSNEDADGAASPVEGFYQLTCDLTHHNPIRTTPEGSGRHTTTSQLLRCIEAHEATQGIVLRQRRHVVAAAIGNREEGMKRWNQSSFGPFTIRHSTTLLRSEGEDNICLSRLFHGRESVDQTLNDWGPWVDPWASEICSYPYSRT